MDSDACSVSLSIFFVLPYVSCVFVWASNDWSLQKDACDDELFLNVFIWSLSGSVTSMLQRTQESHPWDGPPKADIDLGMTVN